MNGMAWPFGCPHQWRPAPGQPASAILRPVAAGVDYLPGSASAPGLADVFDVGDAEVAQAELVNLALDVEVLDAAPVDSSGTLWSRTVR